LTRSRATLALLFVAGLLASCAGTAPVPLAPNIFYVSVPIIDSRDEAAARALAARNANAQCERSSSGMEIQDSRIIEGEGSEPDSFDMVFRCG